MQIVKDTLTVGLGILKVQPQQRRAHINGITRADTDFENARIDGREYLLLIFRTDGTTGNETNIDVATLNGCQTDVTTVDAACGDADNHEYYGNNAANEN